MNKLSFTKHERISLRDHPDFNEAWLHDRICDDPGLLGLGDVRILDHERAQQKAGRLDILLFDEDNNRRYEVEIMLGATDPSHIIRTIEYWDIERRRYPAYDHVAVIIAENVTTRFLNVISLLAGSIPIIAIQLDALKIGDNLVLNFVQVLDQTALREDDTDITGGGDVDRAYWETRVSKPILDICDGVLAIINEQADPKQQFSFKKRYIGLTSGGIVRNFIYLSPKKQYVHVGFQNSNAAEWKTKFDKIGIRVTNKRKGHCRVTVDPKEFQEHHQLLREAIAETVSEFQS